MEVTWSLLFFLGFYSTVFVKGSQFKEACEEFRCTNGRCTSYANLCDGRNDCGDRSDEDNPNCIKCKSEEFTCQNHLQCVPSSKHCDGTYDCADFSDEMDCPGRECRFDQFSCRATDRCISKTLLCDQRDDCGDNSDENMCHEGNVNNSIKKSTSKSSADDKTAVSNVNVYVKDLEHKVPVFALVLVALGCMVVLVLSVGFAVACFTWKFKQGQKNKINTISTGSFSGNLKGFTQQDRNAGNHYDYDDGRSPASADLGKEDYMFYVTEKRKLPDLPGADDYICPENYYSIIDVRGEYTNAKIIKEQMNSY